MAKKPTLTLNDLDKKIEGLDKRLDGKIDNLDKKIDVKIDELGKKIDEKVDSLAAIVEKGFGAVTEDIADVRRELKGDIVRVQEQTASIEAELRYGRYEKRLGDLEEKVFGTVRR